MSKEEIETALQDPRFGPFAAGYNIAKTKFTNPPGQLHYLTDERDAFVAWKQSQL